MTIALPNLAGAGRFELLRHLGTGGMGAVYEALDRAKNARVALKTLATFTPNSLLHLKNEFRSLQDIRHTNLVSLYELIEDGGRWFVAMELVDGVPFLEYVRPGCLDAIPSGISQTRGVSRSAAGETRASDGAGDDGERDDRGDLHVDRLRDALIQLARGLCALHDAGKVHRDVKPSNILVEPGGRVVLVDFGLAIDVSGGRARIAPDGAGTRAYMAPEQAANRSVSAAADWYGVGVLLYQALTGYLPFRGGDAARSKAHRSPESVHAHNPDAPEDLVALCDMLLALDPAARPTGRDVVVRLGAASIPEATRRVSFVGRRDETAALARAFDDSRARPVVVIVGGDSGVGKSALVRDFVDALQVRNSDALVLSGRCYERELVPYKAFDGIVDALSEFLGRLDVAARERLLPPDAPVLARVFPVLRRVAGFDGPEPAAAIDPQEQRAHAFASLRALLDAIARERPLVLTIDDLQWADADSHRLLEDLVRPPSPPSICVLTTARLAPAGAPDAVGELASRLDDVRRIPLGPLPLDEARRLADAALGASGDGGVAASIVLETGGHPLFLLTLAHHASRAGAGGVRELKLDDALRARIESVDTPARRLLELAAVAGAPLSADTMAAAAAVDRATYDASIRALRVEHLVRTTSALGVELVETYHDRIRESLLARIDAPARQECHRSLADALVATGRAAHDALSLVHHLEGANELERAAQQADVAAAHALDALAFEQAAAMIRTAIRLGRHEPAALHARRLQLAEALANAGRGADAAQAFIDAVDGAPPSERLELRRRAADSWLRSGHLDRGLGILADVVHEIGDRFPTQRQAVVATVVRRTLAQWRGLRWTPAAEKDVAPATLRRIDAYHAIGVSLALIDPARGSAFELRALRLALEAGEPRRLAPTLAMEAGYSASTGSRGLSRGRHLLRELRRIEDMGQDGYAGALTPMMAGFVGYHAGHFCDAASTLSRAEDILRDQVGRYFEKVFCRCFRLISLRYCGRFGELQRGFFDWVRDAERRGDRFSEAAIRFNLNGIWLARDAPDEARRDLERTQWIPPEGGYHMQHWYEQHARYEIDLYAGDAARGLAAFRPVASALARSLVLRVRLHRVHVQWLLGRLLLASPVRAAGASAPGKVARIAKRLDREDVPYARTYALLLHAAVAHRRGRDALAAELLERAIGKADEYDYPHCASAARMRLGAIVGGARGEALEAQGSRWMREQGIRDPARMATLWAPGFARESD
jgi:hypothetical protein